MKLKRHKHRDLNVYAAKPQYKHYIILCCNVLQYYGTFQMGAAIVYLYYPPCYNCVSVVHSYVLLAYVMHTYNIAHTAMCLLLCAECIVRLNVM